MPKTILLADDSVTIRRVVQLTFSDTDLRVEAVGSGREALQRLEVLRPDLVLADVSMPEPSGYDICRHVKTSTRPVPVLLLAGTFEPFDPERARSCGADGHIIKPFESSALLRRVQGLLAEPAAVLPRQAPPEAVGPAGPPPSRPAAPAAAAAVPGPGLTLPSGTTLGPEDVDAIARAVVERLSQDVLREIAWEVVPELAEAILRERARQIEGESAG
jgi:CheY-like chemotaxis protein